MSHIKPSWLLPLLLLVVCCLINGLWGMSAQGIADWDEGRQITSAVEMLESGQWLVHTYQWTADYWNAKPPLSLWLTAAGISLFGSTQWGAQASSLLCCLGALLVLYRALYLRCGALAALCGGLIFLSNMEIFLRHGWRTADPDAPFLLCITIAYSCCLREKSAWIWAYFWLGVAFLCKSTHALVVGTPVVLYSVYCWRAGRVSFSRMLFAPCAFLVPVLPYMVARYCADGMNFFTAMLFADTLKRFTQDIEAHAKPWYYYLKYIVENYHLLLAIFFVFIAAAWRKRIPVCAEIIFCLVASAGIVGVFSLSVTKHYWYWYPITPLLAWAGAFIVAHWTEVFPRRGICACGVIALLFCINEARLWVFFPDTPSMPVQQTLLRVGALCPRGPVGVRLEGQPWTQSLLAAVRLGGGRPVEEFSASCPPACLVKITAEGAVVKE